MIAFQGQGGFGATATLMEPPGHQSAHETHGWDPNDLFTARLLEQWGPTFTGQGFFPNDLFPDEARRAFRLVPPPAHLRPADPWVVSGWPSLTSKLGS